MSKLSKHIADALKLIEARKIKVEKGYVLTLQEVHDLATLNATTKALRYEYIVAYARSFGVAKTCEAFDLTPARISQIKKAHKLQNKSIDRK